MNIEPYYEKDGIATYCGDSLEVMRGLDDNSIDTIITDPPYALEFMGKGWDKILPPVEVWAEALRVAKPGAMLMAFGGTRTYHRLTCAIEDAGWEIRDCVMWVYGSGFPKSHDISKGIDKTTGAEREVVGNYTVGGTAAKDGRQGRASVMAEGESSVGLTRKLNITTPATPEAQTWGGYGTALKPAWEPIVLAMKPLDGTFAQNALKWGVAGLWIDGGRVNYESQGDVSESQNKQTKKSIGGFRRGEKGVYGKGKGVPCKNRQGRWPANLIHDGSEEVMDEFPQSGNSARPKSKGKAYTLENRKVYQVSGCVPHNSMHDDSGTAARFFYCAKASKAERNKGCGDMGDKILARSCQAIAEAKRGNAVAESDGAFNKARIVKNNHPTVKPLALMRYLCRLTRMPEGGVILDMHMGSGTTGIAAKLEGRDFIGIDNDEESCEIARHRIDAWEPEEVEVDDQKEFGF